METTKLHSEIVGDKQIISYDKKIEKVNYHIKIVLNANGDGAEDIKKKLSALLQNEIKRQLS
ncbi:MAG: hypothetical protein IJ740_05965 [Ruminococcus sp.]|nr:hypothetical protein [Ruminococcus sp.]